MELESMKELEEKMVGNFDRSILRVFSRKTLLNIKDIVEDEMMMRKILGITKK